MRWFMSLMILVAGCASSYAHEVYVSNELDNTISVIDTNTFEVVRSFPTGKRPRGIIL
jgi:YVTN family beta-propeller protein